MPKNAKRKVIDIDFVGSLKTMKSHPQGREGFNKDAPLRSKMADTLEKASGKKIRRKKGFGLKEHPHSGDVKTARESMKPLKRRKKRKAKRGPNP